MTSAMREYALSFGIALAASLVMTLLVRTGARRLGLVAKPRADRWHRKPTSLFGGVAFYAAFMIAHLIRRPADMAGDWLLIACASGMFVVGLVDDLVQLKPYAKLVAQIIICTAFTMFGLRLHWLPSPVADQALTIFWLVGVTNALNLLDNLDGVAGGIAVIASSFLVYFCHEAGQPAAAQMAAAFAGSVLGFLVFNVNPASIFMGDCGSLFLGFFLGGVTMVNNQFGLRRNIMAVLAIPVLLLLIPIIDTTLVTVLRKLNGRPVSQGGRDHTSHRLVALGFGERGAALALWVLAAASGGVAVVVHVYSVRISILVVAVFAMMLAFIAVFIGRVRVYDRVASEAEGRGRALLPTLADFTYKRRIFEVFNDLVLIVVADYGAFLLRFDGATPEPYYTAMINALPYVVVVQLSMFLVLGLYRGLWRYTSMSDVPTVVKAVVGAWIASTVTIALVFRLENFSRGMLVMQGVLLFGAVAGTRIAFRAMRAVAARLQGRPPTSRRVVIYGAGDGGELLLRELQNNRALNLLPIGFVDDDPQKHGRVIHGVRVIGALDRITGLTGDQRPDEVIVSTTKLANERSAELARFCASAGIPFRRLRIDLE
jgi:UDP-GlcNAc:undecaprenyl-phosphate GlcNAc-1-phosphate transferase